LERFDSADQKEKLAEVSQRWLLQFCPKTMRNPNSLQWGHGGVFPAAVPTSPKAGPKCHFFPRPLEKAEESKEAWGLPTCEKRRSPNSLVGPDEGRAPPDAKANRENLARWARAY